MHDVEQITAAAEVLDGPLAGSLGLLGPVHRHHQMTRVLRGGVGSADGRWVGGAEKIENGA